MNGWRAIRLGLLAIALACGPGCAPVRVSIRAPVCAQDAAASRGPVGDLAPARFALAGNGMSATMSGPIGRGTAAAFWALAKRSPGLRMLRLESPGGFVEEARAVANIARSLELDTYVADRCASACTLVFQAGHARWLRPGARMGFHGYAAAPGHAATRDEVEAAQAVDRAGFRANGLQGWFADRIFATPHTALWEPSAREMLAAGFATGVTVDDDPLAGAAHDGLPGVNPPVAGGEGMLPKVIVP